jgi:NAD(P)-dependent dehydrogenase (short-subunit alcohol dehydrogenase family)
MIDRTLLVIGNRPGSLGAEVESQARKTTVWEDRVFAADHGEHVADSTTMSMDATDRADVVRLLEEVRPTDILCTVGINLDDGENMAKSLSLQLQVNVWGPMQILAEAIDMWNRAMLPPETGFNFCAISSNSAHIARSTGAGYCASKAALSMALRCVARRVAPAGVVRVWGYEPGWINDTPMSDAVHERLPANVRPHRIPGGRGLSKGALAGKIVGDLYVADRMLNGCMFRLDGGEQ